MIYLEQPENFQKKFDVSSLFLEHNGEILLLHRQDHKPQGDTWGVPAGKLDEGEDMITAICRELDEETKIKLKDEHKVDFLRTLYVRYPNYDFMYHMYICKLDGERPEVKINLGEHKNFIWINPKDALLMNLIEDEDECIKMTYINSM